MAVRPSLHPRQSQANTRHPLSCLVVEAQTSGRSASSLTSGEFTNIRGTSAAHHWDSTSTPVVHQYEKCLHASTSIGVFFFLKRTRIKNKLKLARSHHELGGTHAIFSHHSAFSHLLVFFLIFFFKTMQRISMLRLSRTCHTCNGIYTHTHTHTHT